MSAVLGPVSKIILVGGNTQGGEEIVQSLVDGFRRHNCHVMRRQKTGLNGLPSFAGTNQTPCLCYRGRDLFHADRSGSIVLGPFIGRNLNCLLLIGDGGTKDRFALSQDWSQDAVHLVVVIHAYRFRGHFGSIGDEEINGFFVCHENLRLNVVPTGRGRRSRASFCPIFVASGQKRCAAVCPR